MAATITSSDQSTTYKAHRNKCPHKIPPAIALLEREWRQATQNPPPKDKAVSKAYADRCGPILTFRIHSDNIQTAIQSLDYCLVIQVEAGKAPRVSAAQISQLADLFALLGDTTRLRIVMSCLREPVNVGGIADRLELSASLVSHHLRLLRAARLLRSERRGKQIFYSVLDDHIQCVIEDMVAHLDEDPDSEESG